MSRGDFAAAQGLQADTARTRPSVLAIRSAAIGLQGQITRVQQLITNQLVSSQGELLVALIGMCVVVAAIVTFGLASVWLRLLKPFRSLRQAIAAVSAGTTTPGSPRAAMVAGRAEYFADPRSQLLDTELKLSGLRQDGRRFPAEITLSGLATDGGMLVTAAIRDVTERLALQAERERLRAIAEQEKVERRLQQSQRLESLGQLVGGVAHDFNNLLNIIQGYADFSSDQVQALAQSDARLEPVLDDIEQVRVAAQQATRLTRQLLTFARHEVNRPEVLDLNEAVKGAGQLLCRTLGEHIDLTIDTGNAEVDAAYATRRPELKPGRYARLRVSDTGMGMDRATAERVFEPFFSTKPKGRGTGLGLATVYGVVTQAGGSIEIYSEKGLGTTVSVLLPATDEDAGPYLPPAAGHDDHRGHGETVLVVEDEDSLRELTTRVLTRSGYQVCAVGSGSEAVRRASDPAQPIDLLLTDVVMPEMLGHEVAPGSVPSVPAYRTFSCPDTPTRS
ncbi:MAG: ATP-binding protein [Actinomycetota bacterium]|nr:ATP-binding protein [Actinomycetota bacterium]